jgi:ubiquitin-protein ligase
VTSETRQQRLAAELKSLRTLRESSNIFEFETFGEPPDRYTVEFRGRGVRRDASSRSNIRFVEEHKVDIRLPFAFPDRPPDIRWLSPIFHPNVSYSGFINITDVGLIWDTDLGLDVLCERLWDVARMAFVDLDEASNFTAKQWLEKDNSLQFPVDGRPLRDKSIPSGVNIIHYQRRDGRSPRIASERASSEVLYIGEDTPTPELRRPGPVPLRRPRDDDDILYIGDD